MRGFTVSVATALSALAGSAVAQDSSSCTDGLYMVIARGTGEESGPGVSKVIGQEVSRQIPNSKFIGLDYPATFADPDYNDSEIQGAQAMKDTILKYNKDCPGKKIAVLGYSQGAQVSSDAFCGGTGDPFSNVTAISSDIVESSVVAIVLFGDPSHNPNAKFNKGTSKKEGIFVRPNITVCEGYGDRIVSYCDTGDVYCDSGKERGVHGHYLQVYGDKIVEYIVSQYKKATTTTSSASPSSTPSSTISSTSLSATSSSTSGSPPEATSTNSDSGGSDDPAGSAGSVAAPATGLMVLAGLAIMATLF